MQGARVGREVKLTQWPLSMVSGVVGWADIGAIQPMEHGIHAKGILTRLNLRHMAMATVEVLPLLHKDMLCLVEQVTRAFTLASLCRS